MGAGASALAADAALPPTVDKQTARLFAGAQFDEKAFAAAAKDGVVAKSKLIEAAERSRRMVTVASKCAAHHAAFNQRVNDAVAAEVSCDEAAKLAKDAFWEGQAREPFWVVPMGDASAFTRHCGLLIALERACAAGKTPLLIDNSEDKVIDTYFSYKQAR